MSSSKEIYQKYKIEEYKRRIARLEEMMINPMFNKEDKEVIKSQLDDFNNRLASSPLTKYDYFESKLNL